MNSGEPVKSPPEELAPEFLEDVAVGRAAEEEAGAGGRAKVRVRSSGWVFAAQIARTGMSIPTGIILARALGPTGKGSVAVVQALAAMIVMITNLGLPNAVGWLAAKGKASAQQALGFAAILAVAVAALLGTAALVIGPQRTADFLGINSMILLAIAVVGVMPMMFNIFEDAYLMGRGVVRDSQIVDITMLAVGLGVYALLWSQHRLTVLTALAVWLVQFVIIASLKAWRAWRRSPHGRWSLAPVWAQGRAYALKSWAGNTVNMLSLRQDVVLLAMLAGPTQVGIYTIGVAAAELAWYVPNALQGVATAKFAAEEDSLELAQRLNRSIWPFTLVFSLFILLVAIPLIPLVYGGAFKASIAPLVLLLPGILATSMSTSLAAWLSGRGHPEDYALANGVNMVVNLAANLLLDRRFGASGAAIASSLSYAAGSALIMWRFHRRSGSSLHEVLVPRRSDLTSMAGVITGAIQRRIGGRGKVSDS